MKALYVLAVAQLLISSYLLLKISHLEGLTQTSNLIENLSTNSETKFTEVEVISKLDQPFSQSLTLQDIRAVVRSEIEQGLADLTLDIQSKPLVTEVLQELPENPQKIIEISSQLDSYLSDNQMSAKELTLLESELINLNYKDRQRVLQKMAKVMSKANATFNN